MVATAVSIGWLIKSISSLLDMMEIFVTSIEMNDATVRFQSYPKNSALARIINAMNRIVNLYNHNNREVETRKLYYDRILRVMTHEMRNGITPIIALSDELSLNHESYSSDELVNALQIINSQSKGIKHFLDSYHTLTHIPQPEKSVVDADSFMKELKRIWLFELDERRYVESLENIGSEVISITSAANLKLNIDKSLFQQALTNLVRNSLDAVPYGIAPKIQITLCRAGQNIQITVEDNGNGFNKENIENIFQPFVTTKANGNGIGLFISRQIIRLHGGEIKLLSTSAKGSSFLITLPDH